MTKIRPSESDCPRKFEVHCRVGSIQTLHVRDVNHMAIEMFQSVTGSEFVGWSKVCILIEQVALDRRKRMKGVLLHLLTVFFELRVFPSHFRQNSCAGIYGTSAPLSFQSCS